ncbi:MAG: hypothetical protein ACI9DK_002468 [Vicingaceae bacterium]|jgi:hypothetical protein
MEVKKNEQIALKIVLQTTDLMQKYVDLAVAVKI